MLSLLLELWRLEEVHLAAVAVHVIQPGVLLGAREARAHVPAGGEGRLEGRAAVTGGRSRLGVWGRRAGKDGVTIGSWLGKLTIPVSRTRATSWCGSTQRENVEDAALLGGKMWD